MSLKEYAQSPGRAGAIKLETKLPSVIEAYMASVEKVGKSGSRVVRAVLQAWVSYGDAVPVSSRYVNSYLKQLGYEKASEVERRAGVRALEQFFGDIEHGGNKRLPSEFRATDEELLKLHMTLINRKVPANKRYQLYSPEINQ